MLQITALVHDVLTDVQTVMPRQSSAVQLAPARMSVPLCMQYGSVPLAPGGLPYKRTVVLVLYLSGLKKADLVPLRVYIKPQKVHSRSFCGRTFQGIEPKQVDVSWCVFLELVPLRGKKKN